MLPMRPGQLQPELEVLPELRGGDGGGIRMIVFELTMPHCGSWNGKWSQEGRLFVRTRDEKKVPKELWGRSYFYHWDDGWEACVSLTRMPADEARKLERRSDGFCGYDWMIDSIIRNGRITTERSSDG